MNSTSWGWGSGLLFYCCLHGLAPPYLASDLQRVVEIDDRRRLRSLFIVDRHTQHAFNTSVHCWWLRLSCGCSTCMEQFAGHCHIVAIAADIQEMTQDRTVCSQLSRLLAAATSDTCFIFFFPHRSHVSFTLFFFVRCPRSLWHYATLISSFNNNNNNWHKNIQRPSRTQSRMCTHKAFWVIMLHVPWLDFTGGMDGLLKPSINSQQEAIPVVGWDISL